VSQAGAFQGGYDRATDTWYSGEDYIGYLKVSPDGSRIAQAIKGIRTFEVLDFNNATGRISNPVTLHSPEFITPYGVEFSPDGSKLYGTTDGTRALFQWDLSAGSPQAIAASRVQLATVGWEWEHQGGALQTGPDGKIYVAKVSNQYVGVIHRPNEAGAACGYVDRGISLDIRDGIYRVCNFGLPNIVASAVRLPAFTFEGVCSGGETRFRPSYTYGVDSVRWHFNDPTSGSGNTSARFDPTHVFRKPGTYQVIFSAYREGLAATSVQAVTIKPLPVAELGRDTTLCARNELVLEVNVPQATYRWSDGSTQAFLAVREPGVYRVAITRDGCTFTDSVAVDFAICPVRVPNVFTPNADGYNDTFVVEGLVSGKWRLMVYDRWGREIYTNRAYRNEWDGRGMAGGTYFYLLTDPHLGRHYKGWVQLLR
jgi:gliding motility-associated-like protein